MSPISTSGKVVLQKDFAPQGFMYDNPSTFGLWSPSQLTTELWLDASDSNTVTVSGGVVNQWDDKSGNSNNATRTTGDVTYLTASQNGLNTIRLHASPTRMTFTRITSIGHVFFVAKKDDLDVNTILMRDGIGNDRRGVSIARSTIGTGSNLSVQQLSPGILGTGYTRNAWHFGEIETTGTTATLGVDATRVSGSNTNLMSASELGYYHYQPGGYGFKGEVAELIISLSVLSTSDRQKMEGYLAHKWGLVDNLPSAHPYKTGAPML